MRIEHFRPLNKMARNQWELEELIYLYHKKSHDYFMRDMRLGKAVSLVCPRPQEERALIVVSRYYDKILKPQYKKGGIY